MCYSPWGCTELDTTKQLSTHTDTQRGLGVAAETSAGRAEGRGLRALGGSVLRRSERVDRALDVALPPALREDK